LPVSDDVWGDISVMQKVLEVMDRHEGSRPVDLLIREGVVLRRFRCRKRKVEWSEDLAEELSSVIGSGRVNLVEEALAAVA